MARCFALVPCAGSGSRAGTVKPKQYELIAGQSMVMHTLAALQSVSKLENIVLVVSPSDSHAWPHLDTPSEPSGGEKLAARKPIIRRIKCGGASRAESVFNGLTNLLAEGAKDLKGLQASDWILVHDAARCLITELESGIL